MQIPCRKHRIVVAAFALLAAAVSAQETDGRALRAAISESGTLRAAFLATNPMQGTVDPVTHEVTGPAADLAAELGRRMGVPVSLQPLPGVPAVIDAVRNGSADIGFLAYDATRAEQVAYTQAYLLGHNSYIVPADSAIRRLADADRSGTRIGARDGVAVDLYLSRTLANATLIHVPRATTEDDATRMILDGELDAYAANTERLAIAAAIDPRLRVVDGSLMYAEQSIVVPLDNEGGTAALNRFIDEARASGLLERIVDRYGMAGVEVAPENTR